jgi:O-antigen ligase
MISGTILGLIALAFLVVVALGGGAGGTGVIVVIVAGVALVYFGGRMHGLRSRS